MLPHIPRRGLQIRIQWGLSQTQIFFSFFFCGWVDVLIRERLKKRKNIVINQCFSFLVCLYKLLTAHPPAWWSFCPCPFVSKQTCGRSDKNVTRSRKLQLLLGTVNRGLNTLLSEDLLDHYLSNAASLESGKQMQRSRAFIPRGWTARHAGMWGPSVTCLQVPWCIAVGRAATVMAVCCCSVCHGIEGI